MIINTSTSESVEKRSDLVGWFYPSLIGKQSIIISNKNNKLQKIIKKNNNVADLMNRLDMMQV